MTKKKEEPVEEGVVGLALDDAYAEIERLKAKLAAFEPPKPEYQPYPKWTSAGIVGDEAEHRLKCPQDFD